MQKVLFISNALFLDENKPEGGVRSCTIEFIELLKQQYEVILFPVKTKTSLVFKIKNKIGLAGYDAYEPQQYAAGLKTVIQDNGIKLVFCNLANLIRFSKVIKEATAFGVKVIMCSHGNESGDFLHEAVRFNSQLSFYRRWFFSVALGRMIKTESFYRLHYIDMVLTVSEVESELEKWLGAKRIFMVPRTVKASFLQQQPVQGRVGFVGDLSHLPNHSGILSFCEALKTMSHSITIRIAGGPADIGHILASDYPFVAYLGYLENSDLEKEAASWSLFINPVFYYSRGVSTKLAKALGWGIPVISTTAGIRGYQWNKGIIQIAETAEEMAKAVVQSNTKQTLPAGNAKDIVDSMPVLKDIMQKLYPQLQAL